MIVVRNEEEFKQAVKIAEKGEIILWDERFTKKKKVGEQKKWINQ